MLEGTLNKGKDLDSKLHEQAMNKRQIWRQVLPRLLDVMKFLTYLKVLFRGHQEDVYSSNKGNIKELVELMGKYDPVLEKYYLKEVTGSTCHWNSNMNSFISWETVWWKIYWIEFEEPTILRLNKTAHRTFLILISWLVFIDTSLLKTKKWRCRNYFLVLSLSMGKQLMISRKWFWIGWRKRKLILKNIEE